MWQGLRRCSLLDAIERGFFSQAGSQPLHRIAIFGADEDRAGGGLCRGLRAAAGSAGCGLLAGDRDPAPTITGLVSMTDFIRFLDRGARSGAWAGGALGALLERSVEELRLGRSDAEK